MAGGNHLLVDHRSNIERFRHVHIVEVFHLSDGFPHASAPCRHAGKDVFLVVFGECDEGVELVDALIDEKFHVVPLSIDDHGVVLQQASQFFTPCQAGLHNPDVHAGRKCPIGSDGEFPTSDDKGVLHIRVPFFARETRDFRDVVASGHEEDEVAR